MSVIVGLDEVGRGCLAGPLVAAAVIIPDLFSEDCPLKLRDSKKLTRNQREKLDVYIRSKVISLGVGWVKPSEIDRIGLTKSVQLAMLRAMKELHANSTSYDQIIIDGNYNFFNNVTGLKTTNIQAIIRADDTVLAVSAASIIAKVARDNYMKDISERYPKYGFAKHVGYGTTVHREALLKYGITDIHRKSFAPIRSLLG